MNARWTPDATARALAAANNPTRAHKRRFTLQGAGFVLAIVGAFLVGVTW